MYIIVTLLSKKFIHAKDIAEKYDVTVRTIYRDIDTLTLAGIPIYSQRGSQAGFYIDANYKLNTLLFSNEEKKIIQELSRSMSTTYHNIAFENLEKKMSYFLENENIDTSSYFFDFTMWKMKKEIFDEIEKALNNSKILLLEYTNFQNEVSTRRIEPINLVYKSHIWYLYGFCQKRNDLRLFRVSRIRNLRILDVNFDSSKYKRISSEVIDEFFNKVTTGIKLEEVCLKFSSKVRAKVYDTFDEENLSEEEGKIILRKNVYIDDWFLNIILGFKSNVYVVSPISLKIKIKEIAYEIFSQYDIE